MSALYVVATPIGNLGDISARAIEVLSSVDFVASEDTRHTNILLARYSIKTPLVSYHQHSKISKIDYLIEQLVAGKDIALVTDAGTPGISDPGGVLVEAVYEKNNELKQPIAIIPIPGPSAVTAALSAAGFPSDRFLFLGFLPKKKGRQTLLQALARLDPKLGVATIVFYESANRVNRTLVDIKDYFVGVSIEICLARELTKKFEELWRGPLPEAIEQTKTPSKGEYVVVLSIVGLDKH